MERAREGRQLDYQRDPATFAHELLIAREAGLLDFDDRSYGPRIADPRYDAHQWLQQVSDVRLTIPGRDRARGRVIITPLADPEQDDGRIITGYALEQIARALGETYTMGQLPRFLSDSGIPTEFIPEPRSESKWQYVLPILESLLVGGSAARRALRTFIGAWLSGKLHAPPGDRDSKTIVALLAQQGWHVKEGVLVIGDRIAVSLGALSPLDRDSRIASLHATIRQVADRYLESHMEVAIFEAFKAVNNRVKEMTGLNADGSDLMATAFGDDRDPNPPIRLADVSKESGRNIQSGFRFIFMGAVRGIRNPDAHELFEPVSEEEAFEELSLASMLMRRLDDASVR
jgi:uncharacterized protein (TIGR02391 family)